MVLVPLQLAIFLLSTACLVHDTWELYKCTLDDIHSLPEDTVSYHRQRKPNRHVTPVKLLIVLSTPNSWRPGDRKAGRLCYNYEDIRQERKNRQNFWSLEGMILSLKFEILYLDQRFGNAQVVIRIKTNWIYMIAKRNGRPKRPSRKGTKNKIPFKD